VVVVGVAHKAASWRRRAGHIHDKGDKHRETFHTSCSIDGLIQREFAKLPLIITIAVVKPREELLSKSIQDPRVLPF